MPVTINKLVAPLADTGLAPLRGAFRETLVGYREALAALSIAGGDDLASAASVRRLARTVRGVSAQLGLWSLSTHAGIVSSAEGDIDESVGRLIELLDDAIESSGEEPVRILIVEPDPDNGALLTLTLAAPHREVVHVLNGDDASTRLEIESFSLIILEVDLPDTDGRDLLAALRMRSATALVPVFMLSSTSDPTIKTECLALGADAFFEKPYDPASLSSVVAAKVQRRASFESLDPLTGLPDRTAFDEAFRRVRSIHSGSDAVVLGLIEIDHFAAITDLNGPTLGDVVLRRTGDLLAQILPSHALIARWDRARFVALFPDYGIRQAAEELDRALQAVRHEPFATKAQHPFSVSFSAGVISVGEAMRTSASALAAAEVPLAEAQARGGAQIVTIDDELPPQKLHVLVAEDDPLVAKIVTHSLERAGFVVLHEENGHAAVSTAANHHIGLVVLDVQLPGLGGFEILSRLREMPSMMRVPIIMLTGIGGERDILRGFELGADDYILKPFSRIELIARAKRLLARRTRAIAN